MALPVTKHITNLAPFLPALIRITTEDQGVSPMRLDDFFPFEDVFSTMQPPRVVHRSSRQIGKTYQIAARLILEAAIVDGTRIIVVTPLQSQSDGLSSRIFRPMIDSSPVRVLLSETANIGNVRTRGPFTNGSLLHFSYCQDVEDTLRLRSHTGRVLFGDEAQSIDPGAMPAVEQTLRASKKPQIWISGTSLTKDTFLEAEWNDSSQGVWQIRCHACGFENICAIEPEGHLLAMLGPFREDISEERPGVICRRCGPKTPISPRRGRWVHRFPERLRDFAGYYAPQILFPIHYAYPNKWKELLGFSAKYSTGKFYNECLGEAYDMAYKLFSIEDLRKAAVLNKNTIEEAERVSRRYQVLVLGIDWGGGGDDGVSRTKGAIVGLAEDGVADVIFGFGFQPSTDRIAEGRAIVEIAARCNVHLIAHDFGGGIGTASEAAITHNGWPLDRIVPIKYSGVDTAELRPTYHQPNDERIRGHYSVHKSKSLQFLSQAVRYGKMRFFEYDYKSRDEPGHLHDFLSLVEDKIDTPTGTNFYIRRSSKTVCDDFSAATNFAALCLWQYTSSWPEFVVAGSVGGPG